MSYGQTLLKLWRHNYAMLDTKLEQASPHWVEVSKILYFPHSEKEYKEAVRLLDNLIDTIGENENHPLASLMEILGFSSKSMKTNMCQR